MLSRLWTGRNIRSCGENKVPACIPEECQKSYKGRLRVRAVSCNTNHVVSRLRTPPPGLLGEPLSPLLLSLRADVIGSQHHAPGSLMAALQLWLGCSASSTGQRVGWQ